MRNIRTGYATNNLRTCPILVVLGTPVVFSTEKSVCKSVVVSIVIATVLITFLTDRAATRACKLVVCNFDSSVFFL